MLENERWLFADLTEPVEPERLAGGEVLCHLAYSAASGRENIAYNRHLLDAVNDNPNIKQVVLMSTTSVYGTSDSPVIDEESPCNPVGEYAETKLACEMLWRERLRDGCALAVLRPSEVIGPGGKGLIPLVRDALHRPLVGAAKRSVLYHRPLHYVAVSNAVAAVRFCLRRSRDSEREVYVVSDDHRPENRGYAAMQDTVRGICGRRPLPGVAAPRWALRGLGRLTGRPLGLAQTFSSRKIHTAGFKDAVTLRDEVRRVVRSMERSA